MPRPTTKKPKAKGPKLPSAEEANGNLESSAVSDVAVAELPPQPPKEEPAEPAQENKEPSKGDGKTAEDKDKIAATAINIAKLQAMSMTELNQMARELNVENFGTMRKHEVICH